jgi:asparagine synthetase B (glutamine-hydrolysing)
MCSILFFKTKKRTLNYVSSANDMQKMRGPDETGSRVLGIDGYHYFFLHNLLDISGRAVKQPISSRDTKSKIILFNGEIYNHKDYSNSLTDTESLLDYFNSDKPVKLIGEYAIFMFDEHTLSGKILTDAFLTKPLYIGYTEDPDEFAIASYSSVLQKLGCTRIEICEPNSRYDISFKNNAFVIARKTPNVEFSLIQHKSSYEDWIEAFIESVRIRALHGSHAPMVALSSGYDSGAIALAMNLLGIKYHSYTISSGESAKILDARFKRNNQYELSRVIIPGINQFEYRKIQKEIRKFPENFQYFHDDGDCQRKYLCEDDGAIAGFKIAEVARKNGIVVSLSGSGSDEIISDYGYGGEKIYYHSEFGGLFPENLKEIFPWKKFYWDTQRSYLFKEEVIFGHFGIESRYPFLDINVVQEYLNLTADLKNENYKAPIKYFFDKYEYPYEEGRKRGFTPKNRNIFMSLGSKIKSKMNSLSSS